MTYAQHAIQLQRALMLWADIERGRSSVERLPKPTMFNKFYLHDHINCVVYALRSGSKRNSQFYAGLRRDLRSFRPRILASSRTAIALYFVGTRDG